MGSWNPEVSCIKREADHMSLTGHITRCSLSCCNSNLWSPYFHYINRVQWLVKLAIHYSEPNPSHCVIVFWQWNSPTIRIHWSALQPIGCVCWWIRNFSASSFMKSWLIDWIPMSENHHTWIEISLLPAYTPIGCMHWSSGNFSANPFMKSQ